MGSIPVNAFSVSHWISARRKSSDIQVQKESVTGQIEEQKQEELQSKSKAETSFPRIILQIYDFREGRSTVLS